MTFNWIKSKFTHLSMTITLIISISGLSIEEKTKTLAPDSAYSTKVQAAQIMIVSLNRSSATTLKRAVAFSVSHGVTSGLLTRPFLKIDQSSQWHGAC